MEQPATKTQGPDLNSKGFSLSNGTPKKAAYRECLKNHAASLGGHALDGCGEFMPSLAANPSDPTSLRCAACGCHRNFHRRIAFLHVIEGEGERFGDNDYGEEDDLDGSRPRSPSPQVLLALRTGIRDGDSPAVAGKPFAIRTPVMAAAIPPLRKRFRSRFSSEQKERMMDLCEKLGWRMQRKDEELVDKCCSEIGVSKGVFKVWMHNNKHHLFGQLSSRRGDPTNVGASNDAGAAINGVD